MNHNHIAKIASAFFADQCFEIYKHAMGWQNPEEMIVNVMEIYDNVIYPEYEFSLDMSTDLGEYENQKVLGKTMPKEKIIAIDPSIAPATNDPRFPFTMAHEIGHALLHQSENMPLCRTTASTFANKHDPLEREANAFAVQLLMPSDLVQHRFQEYYGRRSYPYVGPRMYWINGEKVYIRSLLHLCLKLAAPLTRYFSNVSKASLAYTLHNIGLIANQKNEKIGPNVLFLPESFLSPDCHDFCDTE